MRASITKSIVAILLPGKGNEQLGIPQEVLKSSMERSNEESGLERITSLCAIPLILARGVSEDLANASG